MSAIDEYQETDQNRSELDSLESLLAWETDRNPEKQNLYGEIITDQNAAEKEPGFSTTQTHHKKRMRKMVSKMKALEPTLIRQSVSY
jgi:hypothetical protein